jgi:hypothetical protein
MLHKWSYDSRWEYIIRLSHPLEHIESWMCTLIVPIWMTCWFTPGSGWGIYYPLCPNIPVGMNIVHACAVLGLLIHVMHRSLLTCICIDMIWWDIVRGHLAVPLLLHYSCFLSFNSPCTYGCSLAILTTSNIIPESQHLLYPQADNSDVVRGHRWHICQWLAKAALTGVGRLKLVECHRPCLQEDTLYQILYHRPQQITICWLWRFWLNC